MPTLLPLEPSVAHYRFTITIEDIVYICDVRWNDREGVWYMDLYSEDEDPIRHGMALVLGAVPGRTCQDPRFPPGAFIVSDLENSGTDAAFDDMGERVVVYYYTAQEIADGE